MRQDRERFFGERRRREWRAGPLGVQVVQEELREVGDGFGVAPVFEGFASLRTPMKHQ